MTNGSWLPSWVRRQSDHFDIGAGLAAGLAVVAVALLQWGITDEGWTRGVTLGTALGVVVALSVRRGRLRSAARERAEEEERLQLARELHDAVASQVSIIGIQAAAARRVMEAEPSRAREALNAIEVAARTANGDLRRMLATLRATAPTTSAPELRDLAALADEYRMLGLEVEIDESELDAGLPAAIGAIAYRVVQEALANALAHAGRVRASVKASSTADVVRLTINNEPGRPESVHPGSGLGLQGIRERAERYGGTVAAGPRSDGGFRVDVTIPVRRP